MTGKGDTHMHGPTGAVFTGEKPEVTINVPCPGPHACPHRSCKVPQSLENEEAFRRLAGFRADPREQELLEEFRQRHKLRWRGSRSIGRMRRHRTLEYDSSRDSLRLNPSFIALTVGWVYFFGCAFVALIVSVSPMFAHRFKGDKFDIVILVFIFMFSIFGMWMTIEHMVLPESLARQLLKKERELETNQGEKR